MKKIAVIDIDGTVSKVGDRLKYLQQDKKDWDAFYAACEEDEPIEHMCKTVASLMQTHTVVFCTGRRDSVKEATTRWIYKNIIAKYAVDNTELFLAMRPDGDHRHDTEVKPEMLGRALARIKARTSDIDFILEDRNSMVDEWRKLGFVCIQVAAGDF